MSSYKDILSRYATLLPPLFISFFISIVGIAMADTLMVGRLGAKYLAAASLSNNISGIFFVFSVGMGVGLTPLFSSAHGNKDYNTASNILIHGIITNLIVGLILYSSIIIVIHNLGYLKQNPEVVSLASPYAKIVALSLIPNSIKDILRRYIEGLNHAKTSMVFSIITFVINVILNYGLINGKLGLPRMELVGAGVATLIARAIEPILISVLIMTKYHKEGLFTGVRAISIKVRQIIDLLKVTVPCGTQITLEVGFFGFLGIMIGWIGVYDQAAHAILVIIFQATFMFPLSMSLASSIIIGFFYGQKDFPQIKKTGHVGYYIIAIFCVVEIIFLILFYKQVFSLYQASEEIIKIASAAQPALICFILIGAANVFGVNSLRGLRDTFVPVLITSISQWAIGIPLAYALAFIFHWGLRGIWWGAVAGFYISAIMIFIRFTRRSSEKYLSVHKGAV